MGQIGLSFSLTPHVVRLPRAIQFDPATGDHPERVPGKAQQVVLQGIARGPFLHRRAKGPGPDYMDAAAVGAHVVSEKAGVDLMNVPVKAGMEPRLGQPLHEAVVLDAVFMWAGQRMMPDGEFKTVFQLWPFPDPVQGKGRGIRVDGNSSPEMMVRLPYGIESTNEKVQLRQMVEGRLLLGLKGIGKACCVLIEFAEMPETKGVCLIIPQPNHLFVNPDELPLL